MKSFIEPCQKATWVISLTEEIEIHVVTRLSVDCHHINIVIKCSILKLELLSVESLFDVSIFGILIPEILVPKLSVQSNH